MPSSTPKPRAIDWPLLLILLAGGLLGFLATIPLVVQWLPRLVSPGAKAEFQKNLPMPLPAVFALGFVQNAAIFGVAIAVGLVLGKKVGLGAPELEAWRAGSPRPGLARRLALAAIIGLGTGLLLIVLDAFLFLPRTGLELAKWMADVPLWKRLLAGLVYGGITEELICRFFLVTLLAWLLGKFWRTPSSQPDGQPTPGAIWTAILIATFLFALGHLPLAARLGELTPWLVARVLVLNGVAGTVYGYLYTRRGLESAMAAHAATHIPLQILAGTAASIAQSVS
ncbi:MAG: CPBP family intramembrane metalloprotease [Phycisphaeraceae bacterium]|nr:CPBP family intramembrane metalloprotease [Phycisphaeraceae bacterium]